MTRDTCSWRGRRRWGCGWSWSRTTARPPGQSTTPSGESVIKFAFDYHHCGQAGRGGRGLPAVGGRILGQRQRLPLRSQRVQVLHHRQVRHVTRWTRVCVTKKLHVAGTMTRRPTAAPAPRPTEGGGGSTGKLVWLIDILLTPHGFESYPLEICSRRLQISTDQYCTLHILLGCQMQPADSCCWAHWDKLTDYPQIAPVTFSSTRVRKEKSEKYIIIIFFSHFPFSAVVRYYKVINSSNTRP